MSDSARGSRAVPRPAVRRRARAMLRGRPLSVRERLAARLAGIADEGGPPGEVRRRVLAETRAALEAGRAAVRRRFRGGLNGWDAAKLTSGLMDGLIAVLFEFAATRVFPGGVASSAERLSVAATGGYGRGELAPFSDIDLLFLIPYKPTARIEQVVEYLLYMLWDLGLSVGQAIRSVEECVRQAQGDVTVRTAILDARCICGDEALFAEFGAAVEQQVIKGTALEFFDAKLAERDARHQRMGDSRYVLEPNVKEGKGGLRDLHTLYWLWAYVDGVRELDKLAERGLLTAAEARSMLKALRFLWSVRFHLHYRAGRAEEVLTFDAQPEVALAMGYTRRAGARSVERFMKHYFLIAKDVGTLTRVLCAAYGERLRRRPFWQMPRLKGRWRLPEGLAVEGDWLSVAHPTVFARDPVALIRIFREAQERGLDIHPNAFRLIAASLKLIDARLRADAEANRLFLDLLTSPREPDISLRRMNEAGVLGRFVPEFGRVVAQMQYDMYHHYTVDEHTILAVGVLRRLEEGGMRDIAPVASEQVRRIESRRALYVAVLLHDIAKGRPGDHSEQGARIAERLGPRFGLAAAETETVAWLVRRHLLLSRIAFKRDVDDPQTLRDLVGEVQSLERLRLLLLLTVADVRAVGAGVWNNWKATLLREVYFRAEEALTGGLMVTAKDARVAATIAALRRELPDWREDEFEAFVRLASPSFWLAFDAPTLARHARMVRREDRSGHVLKLDTRVDPARGVTEVTVYAPDRPRLFSRIAGAMAVSGANILDARIFTLANGLAVDTFWIQDASGGPFDRPDRIARLSSHIGRAVEGRLEVRAELARRRSLPSRTRVFTVAPLAVIDNAASAEHTVIEVNARDRLGLLHDVTDTLARLGLQISSAHVTTFGERAVDVFYVKDAYGLKVESESRLQAVREALLAALEPKPAPGRARAGKTPPAEPPARRRPRAGGQRRAAAR
ncbi:MAG: [protein-PII] uridylyltransferase [Proteobacteria bacterium]|nr:[protein-PII] uridylyltransferase [Pseudomonadota bacterium]